MIFSRNLSLRIWSNIIFTIAFVIPAILLFCLGIYSVSKQINDQALVDVSKNMEKVIKSYSDFLNDLKSVAESYSNDHSLNILFEAVKNLDKNEGRTPFLKEWLTQRLEKQTRDKRISGIAVITLQKELIVHTHDNSIIPDFIVRNTLVDLAFTGKSGSGIQRVSKQSIAKLNLLKEHDVVNSDQLLLLVAVAPIYENSEVSGALVAYSLLHQQIEWVSDVGRNLNIDLAFYSSKSQLLGYFGSDLEHSNNIRNRNRDPLSMGEGVNISIENFRFKGDVAKFYPLLDHQQSAVGMVVVRIDLFRYLKKNLTMILLFILLTVLGLTLGFVFRLWTFRILNRIAELIELIKKIAAGNYSSQLDLDTNDEFGELAYEINKMTTEIQKRDQLKDYFLANTSHELRTPLHGIIGMAESLKEGTAGAMSQNAQMQLSTIISSGKRLSRLINDILDHSKLKNADLVIDTKTTDIRQLADIVLTLTQPQAKQKEIQLTNAIAENIPLIEGDEERLLQVLHNLVGNAVKFTSHGSITLLAENQQQFIKITVKDTGLGIPKEKQELIFFPFQQADGSISQNYGGTGLGLSTCKYLVELHGGIIGVSSEVGQGSEFYFTIPVSKDQSKKSINVLPYNENAIRYNEDVIHREMSSATDDYRYDEETNSTFKILVVDDDAINLQVISNYLLSSHYSVKIVNNGQDALDFIKQSKPDLVLLDIMMPSMSGFEVCRQIREDFPMYVLPIIFLTAKNQVSDLKEGFSLGANDYITKPFLKSELLIRMARHLELSSVTERMSSLNRFMNETVKLKNVRQMFETAFILICEHINIDSGILLYKDKVIKRYCFDENQWSSLNNEDDFGNAEPSLNQNHQLEAQFDGFEEYRLIFKRCADAPSFREADNEYIRSIIDIIKISRNNIQQFLKEPNIIYALYKIQSLLDEILYIEIKSPYCYVHLDFDTPLELKISMNMIQRFFHEDMLMKTHRSYLINPKKVIRLYDNGQKTSGVVLKNEKVIPISRSLSKKIKNRYHF